MVGFRTYHSMQDEVLVDMDYELGAPCVVQWGLLLFLAPSRLTQKFDSDGTKIMKYHEVTHLAIVAASSVAFSGVNTPRTCLRSVAAVLDRASDKVWDVDREMIGWRLEGRPVLLPSVHDGDTEVCEYDVFWNI